MLEVFLNIKTRRMTPTDTIGIFFKARVSQVNMKTIKKIFGQRSELQVAKGLIVLVLCSSYNVSRLELREKRKATQQCSFCVSNDIVLNQVVVYHERCMRTTVSEIRTKECKSGSFICKGKSQLFVFFETL